MCFFPPSLFLRCIFLALQIFDASTNTWKIVNERSHTDFVEKIVETPVERIIIDDVTDITKIKNINDRTERTTAITDITDVTNINNTINLHEIEENITKIVTNENNLVSVNSHSDFYRFRLAQFHPRALARTDNEVRTNKQICHSMKG